MLIDARLYVISADGPPAVQVATLCAAIDGGADIVQLRNKTATQAELLPVTRQLVAYARSHGALTVINDYINVAVISDADGLHLGQDDGELAAARHRWEGKLIGRSTHSLEQAKIAARQGADYLGVGPVFETPTKPERPAVGIELLAEVASAISIPWFAIGGIDRTNISQVLHAGATRVAVVRAVCAAPDPAAAAAELKSLLLAAPTTPPTPGRAPVAPGAA